MVEFDATEAFIKDAHDCDSIKKALDAVAETGKYGIDYGSDLKKARDILEQRKFDLCCDD